MKVIVKSINSRVRRPRNGPYKSKMFTYSKTLKKKAHLRLTAQKSTMFSKRGASA